MTANDALRAAALLEAVPPQLHTPELTAYALNLMGDADPDYTNATGLRDALAAIDAALAYAPDRNDGAAAAIRWARSLIACAAEEAERDEAKPAMSPDEVAALRDKLWAAQNEANQHALRGKVECQRADRYKSLFEAEQEKNRLLRTLIDPTEGHTGDIPPRGELFLAVLDEYRVVAACTYAESTGIATVLTGAAWDRVEISRLRLLATVKQTEYPDEHCQPTDDEDD